MLKFLHPVLFETQLGSLLLHLFEMLTGCALVPLDHLADEPALPCAFRPKVLQ
jgi:hypothetical protein